MRACQRAAQGGTPTGAQLTHSLFMGIASTGAPPGGGKLEMFVLLAQRLMGTLVGRTLLGWALLGWALLGRALLRRALLGDRKSVV